MSFKNKVVLVTGAGGGMGAATAINFAKEGANVVIVDYNEENANTTAEKCRESGNRVLVFKTDVSKAEEVTNAIENTIKDFGQLDVLVNSAGILREGGVLTGTIMDNYDVVMNTNLRSVILTTTLAAPHLMKTKGCIVNTSSIVSMAQQKGVLHPVYTISKVGVDCFTRLSARELGTFGVRVNSINPGPVKTNLLENSGVDASNYKLEDYINATTLRKLADPEEVAELILFLASDKAKSITGSNYAIDNGLAL